MRWPTVALSIMATQASAITFLSTPGQAYADGMRFVQFYFGLPLAMVVLSRHRGADLPPPAGLHRLRVPRGALRPEDAHAGRGLFLVQRGLAAGLTIYAPALVLSVLLGWNIRVTIALLGGAGRGLHRLRRHAGGEPHPGAAVRDHPRRPWRWPRVVIAARAARRASRFGDAVARRRRARAGSTPSTSRFDPNDRYNLWSGLIGGFFLQLSYFGTDQSQVQRYLTGRSVAQSRLGLLFNGLVKVPMQFVILLLGVLVFVFYQFVAPPVFFNPAERARGARAAPHAGEWRALEARHADGRGRRAAERSRPLLAARRAGDAAAAARAARGARPADQARLAACAREAVALIQRADPGAPTNDTNYVFLSLRAGAPAGRARRAGVRGGLRGVDVLDARRSSTRSPRPPWSTSARRLARRARGDRRTSSWSRGSRPSAGAASPSRFAEYASRLGSLIEAVNILGSLFYGTILGIFLVGVLLQAASAARRCSSAALVAEAAVLACFAFTDDLVPLVQPHRLRAGGRWALALCSAGAAPRRRRRPPPTASSRHGAPARRADAPRRRVRAAARLLLARSTPRPASRARSRRPASWRPCPPRSPSAPRDGPLVSPFFASQRAFRPRLAYAAGSASDFSSHFAPSSSADVVVEAEAARRGTACASRRPSPPPPRRAPSAATMPLTSTAIGQGQLQLLPAQHQVGRVGREVVEREPHPLARLARPCGLTVTRSASCCGVVLVRAPQVLLLAEDHRPRALGAGW